MGQGYGKTTLLIALKNAVHRDGAFERATHGAIGDRKQRPAAEVGQRRRQLREYELLLAQALGAARRANKSYHYLLGLWGVQLGNGAVNLQLARLVARRGDRPAAVNFYRVSIFGKSYEQLARGPANASALIPPQPSPA